MMIGKNIVAMANAGLGVSDAVTLFSALNKYEPSSGGKCPAELMSKLGDRVVFAWKSGVAFVSDAVAAQVIPAFFRKRQAQGRLKGTEAESPDSTRELKEYMDKLADELRKSIDALGDLISDCLVKDLDEESKR